MFGIGPAGGWVSSHGCRNGAGVDRFAGGFLLSGGWQLARVIGLGLPGPHRWASAALIGPARADRPVPH
ncbi:hypothetical protein GCM10022222_40050 [Amycolatopsis ultiminotia]|uniref:Uncharacterized protein n=1 Tax=Amycolatopsis ultiminotia TaxID=543629 RepID=A0ABP6WKY1_9PSEU